MQRRDRSWNRLKFWWGGRRHLGFLDEGDRRERLVWESPLQKTIDTILQRRGQRVCVLATGDPMWYGIGATLARQIPLEEMTLIPAPSAFSLACSRLGWPLADVDTLSLCGRPADLLLGYLYPGVRLLLLSGESPNPRHRGSTLDGGGIWRESDDGFRTDGVPGGTFNSGTGRDLGP